MNLRAERFLQNPIIHSELDQSIGTNLNGPSLIRAPEWVAQPLGRYYLYFAHHQGQFIRLAWADDLGGPWKVHPPGALHLDQTCCRGHIASPDIHVDPDRRQIRMYFHGCVDEGQRTFLAFSSDGLHFDARDQVLGPYYFRVFEHQGWHYAIAKTVQAPGGGILLRSPDGCAPFEPGPDILPQQRHVALQKQGDVLRLFFSRGEDCPERILVSEMALAGDWHHWKPGEPRTLLEPETEYEGGSLPLEPSRFGGVHTPVRQLRDPAVFQEEGRTYLVYSCAGESGLALAEILLNSA